MIPDKFKEDPYYKEVIKAIDPGVIKAIEETFSLTSYKLPSKNTIPDKYKNEKVYSINSINENNPLNFSIPFVLREIYLTYCYVAYNHEFLSSIKELCDYIGIKKAHELSCGTGWFSHWLKKYGVPIEFAVDNKSWKVYDGYFLPHVLEEDSIEFVKRTTDADMYFLSWPYMDDVAFNIWNAMRPGQYMLYIGEDQGGCTANGNFFEVIEGHRIQNKLTDKMEDSFVRFLGLHDYPQLFKK